MPVFNGARYLPAAVESVLAQTERHFEFIILDDGSTDETPKIVDSYARKDDRIRFVRDKENLGVATRLNQGVRMAKAPIIARMDGDDLCAPHRFETQLKFLQDNPEAVMVGSRVEIIDPDGDALMIMGSALSHDEIDGGLMSRRGQLLYHSSVMFRRDVALAVGGYDESYSAAQDVDFFLRMAEAGRIENLSEPLIQYREHFASTGFSRVLDQEMAVDRALEAARIRRGIACACQANGAPHSNGEATAFNGAPHLNGGACENGGPVDAPVKRRAPMSRAERRRVWGWWALKGGHPETARKHAVKAFLQTPNQSESWRLMLCALRGR